MLDKLHQQDRIIHEDELGWWFYIETWADRCGPYSSREEAKKQLEKYCEEVLGVPMVET